MKEMGLDAFRFSISWPRILPEGSLKGGISPDGVQFYKNLISTLKENGIEPYATLFHWDVPQALEDEYGGFLNRRIVDDFHDYCKVCFDEFGGMVKYWNTMNEPSVFSSMGYGMGLSAPGRCSGYAWSTLGGDSKTEPYIVAHHLILAHAAAANTYKKHYQAKQGGQIGITLTSDYFEPYSETYKDTEAGKRALDFALGWFMDPLVYGDYPHIMKALLRERLPTFTKAESESLRGTFDFIGMNYYTSKYARHLEFSEDETSSDSFVQELDSRKDGPIGFWNGSWHYAYPDGLKKLLLHIRWRYNHPAIYITENGHGEPESRLPQGKEALEDNNRIYYISRHLAAVQEALSEGVDVKGYFVWSFIDCFEWASGYGLKFGLIHTDDKLNRVKKKSAKWFTEFLEAS